MRFIMTGTGLMEAGPIEAVKESVKESAKEAVLEFLQTVGTVALDVIRESTYTVALIGGGLCIVLWLGGWKDGKRYASLLFVAHCLIRFLLGGLG